MAKAWWGPKWGPKCEADSGSGNGGGSDSGYGFGSGDPTPYTNQVFP